MIKRLSKRTLIHVLLLSCLSLFLIGATPKKPQGYVTDQTHTLDKNDIYHLNLISSKLKETTDAEFATLIIHSLDNEPIEDAAIRIFDEWKIGDKQKENGALFLVALQDKKMRLEIGYGLEDVITDSQAGTILDTAVLPHFKKGHFRNGIQIGHITVAQTIAQHYGVDLFELLHNDPNLHTPPTSESPAKMLLKLLLIMLFIILFLSNSHFRNFVILIALSGGRGRGGGGHFGGSGFGGFGGGSSGGGGSSRGW